MNASTRAATLDDAAARAGLPAGTALSRIDIIDDVAAAEPIWRGLERDGALFTPYQRYDFIAPWQRHVGQRCGVTPLLVVGSDAAGTPLMLWPLGRARVGPLTVARYLGGKHTNFNLALWRRDIAATFTTVDIAAILDRVAERVPDVDLLVLTNQPRHWGGMANPLALLAHQASPSYGYRGELTSDFGALAQRRLGGPQRKKLRKKQRTLATHGPVRYWRVETPAQVRQVLDAFFTQKSERMAELGLTDAFAVPGMRAFVEAAATEHLGDGRPAIELYAASVDGAIVATYAGLVAHGRFCAIFNSITRGSLAHESPGQLLLMNLVRMCCERGLATFDLGVGEATFKRLFCDEPEPLFDSFVPLTARGGIAAGVCRLQFGIKGLIKRSPAAWSAVRALRRRVGGKLPAAE